MHCYSRHQNRNNQITQCTNFPLAQQSGLVLFLSRTSGKCNLCYTLALCLPYSTQSRSSGDFELVHALKQTRALSHSPLDIYSFGKITPDHLSFITREKSQVDSWSSFICTGYQKYTKAPSESVIWQTINNDSGTLKQFWLRLMKKNSFKRFQCALQPCSCFMCNQICFKVIVSVNGLSIYQYKYLLFIQVKRYIYHYPMTCQCRFMAYVMK